MGNPNQPRDEHGRFAAAASEAAAKQSERAHDATDRAKSPAGHALAAAAHLHAETLHKEAFAAQAAFKPDFNSGLEGHAGHVEFHGEKAREHAAKSQAPQEKVAVRNAKIAVARKEFHAAKKEAVAGTAHVPDEPLPAFAARVQALADKAPAADSHFDNKAYIAPLHSAHAAATGSTMSLDAFKGRLVESNRAHLLHLGRVDMPDPATAHHAAASSIKLMQGEHILAHFHTVLKT